MGTMTIKLPDVGEGIAEAELVEWNVAVGDFVKEDDVLACVMTDKATVEIPSPVHGKVVWLGGELGEQLAVGGPLVRIEVEGAEGPDTSAETERSSSLQAHEVGNEKTAPSEDIKKPGLQQEQERAVVTKPVSAPSPPGPFRKEGQKPLATPAVRLRAKDAGVNLAFVRGSGPAGRITHDDLDAFISGQVQPISRTPQLTTDTVREVKIMGMRRKIAERMANAKRRIPHISIIEEVDVTSLEAVREQLNAERREGRAKLTVLPFIMAAVARAVKEQPMMNALFDDEAEIIREHSAVHIGIATQTKSGLMVPVVRHCDLLSIWDLAAELHRAAEAARAGTASREDLSGSTITISSLGPLGAIATTPIINHPEVAIVGVNRMEVRPRWDGAAFVPRKMMNLSSSFDHRVIDGWDAAVFVKRLKTLLENPTLMFVEM